MAIVGVFIAVYRGSILVQGIITTHMHVLQKKGLANDFIVADLAPGGLDDKFCVAVLPGDAELVELGSGRSFAGRGYTALSNASSHLSTNAYSNTSEDWTQLEMKESDSERPVTSLLDSPEQEGRIIVPSIVNPIHTIAESNLPSSPTASYREINRLSNITANQERELAKLGLL